MKFSSIEITDVMGTPHAKFEPGSLTLITGKNGSGKSSILQSLRYVFAGGHEPGMIRQGAKKGVIQINFDDGKSITKTIVPSGNRVEIVADDFTGAPETYIKELADAFAFDPGKFLSAKPNEVVKVLLDTLPLSFTAEELPFLGVEPGATYTLAELDGVRKQVYDARRDENKAAKKFEAHCAELRKALPPDNEKGEDWASAARRIEADRQALQVQEAAAKDKANAWFVDAKAKLDEKYAADLAGLKQIRDEAKELAKKQFEDDIKVLIAEEAKAQERAQQQARATGTREAADKAHAEFRAHALEAEKCDSLLVAIDAAKEKKLKALPIQGLEFSEDGLKVDGIKWEFINTAKRVSVAFQLAVLRASGKVKFILLDNCECLDGDTWKALCVHCHQQSEWNIIAARVGDGDLQITTVPA